ncbi:hypothetical protein ACFTZI_08370 [Streptomyces decoyicus]|uniref:hypothetical protein n=1 Tax=Streptomyces decoyicus TaxID=249567 RepID=UPI003640D71B
MSTGGPADGTWTVTAAGGCWSLAEPHAGQPAAHLRMDADSAWRLCTRGVTPATALTRVHIDGHRQLTAGAYQIVSIVY